MSITDTRTDIRMALDRVGEYLDRLDALGYVQESGRKVSAEMIRWDLQHLLARVEHHIQRFGEV